MLGKCDENWNLHGEHCSLIVRDQMTWFGAYAHCKRLDSDLFTSSVHEQKFASQIGGQDVWTAKAISTKLNPGLGLKWSGLSALQWASQKINVPDLSCDGCGFMRNGTVYLTSYCFNSRSYICKMELKTGTYDNHQRFIVLVSPKKRKVQLQKKLRRNGDFWAARGLSTNGTCYGNVLAPVFCYFEYDF